MTFENAWRVYLGEGGDTGGTYFFEKDEAEKYLAHLKEVSAGWNWCIEKIVICRKDKHV